MKPITFNWVLILFLFILNACGKHEPEPIHPVPIIPVASVAFFSPVNGSIFSTGDSVNIEAKVISTAIMHGYNLEVRKLHDTIVYYTEFFHDHNDTVMVQKKWPVTIVGPLDIETVITAVLDHDGHIHTARQLFKVQ